MRATGDLGRVHGDDVGRVRVDLAARAGGASLLQARKGQESASARLVDEGNRARRTVYQVPLPVNEDDVAKLVVTFLDDEDDEDDELLFLLHWLPDLV